MIAGLYFWILSIFWHLSPAWVIEDGTSSSACSKVTQRLSDGHSMLFCCCLGLFWFCSGPKGCVSLVNAQQCALTALPAFCTPLFLPQCCFILEFVGAVLLCALGSFVSPRPDIHIKQSHESSGLSIKHFLISLIQTIDFWQISPFIKISYRFQSGRFGREPYQLVFLCCPVKAISNLIYFHCSYYLHCFAHSLHFFHSCVLC